MSLVTLVAILYNNIADPARQLGLRNSRCQAPILTFASLFSTMYPVMGDPPSECGGCQAMVMECFSTWFTIRGPPGDAGGSVIEETQIQVKQA